MPGSKLHHNNTENTHSVEGTMVVHQDEFLPQQSTAHQSAAKQISFRYLFIVLSCSVCNVKYKQEEREAHYASVCGHVKILNENILDNSKG